jgi:hypothetical protein
LPKPHYASFGSQRAEIAADGTGSLLTTGLDEVRISSVARSAGWIATEYANQHSPSTFYSVGADNQ